MKLADLTERITKFEGYPKTADPHDTIELVPKGGRVMVQGVGSAN